MGDRPNVAIATAGDGGVRALQQGQRFPDRVCGNKVRRETAEERRGGCRRGRLETPTGWRLCAGQCHRSLQRTSRQVPAAVLRTIAGRRRLRPRLAAGRRPKGSWVRAELPPDLPPVGADPERLHQVLDNLLDNAVKYAASGTAVRVSARSIGVGVETVVSSSVGEHRPDPERMFDRFYRADASRSAAAGGVGLGLAISRELVSAMRGRLWADFDDEGRLRMHVALPSAAAGGALNPATVVSRPAPPERLGSRSGA